MLIFVKNLEMSTVQIAKKIELLPEMLQAQVADFVEFLLNRHFKNNPAPMEDSNLSAEQKAKLDSRYQEYMESPESVESMEALKTRLMQKYGLSTAG
ncbi:MAG: DUF2281 domain-containing protein [Saprospiraceae bacterium]|nr:DUF2281 domain-containing protein [Saprospiraceae bacterium]